MNNIKHFPRRSVRHDQWGDYEWRERLDAPATIWQPTTQETPRRVPFERMDYRASRAAQVRRLLVWVCVTFTLLCIVLAAVAVVAVS